MIDYTLSIDTSGGKDPNGYFTIDTIQLNDADSEFIDGARKVERRAFGEIEVKNMPYQYAKLGGAKYNLYDIISSVQPNQEIHLKFVSAYETIYAYFGVIDCKLDFDKRKITIKPYILDQYTDLLENKDTEVKLFDETNQIVNGDFKEWTGENPDGWTQNPEQYLKLSKSFRNDQSFLSLSDQVYNNENQITFKGTWNPSTNTPNLNNIVNPQNGDYYEAMAVGDYQNSYGDWHYVAGMKISYSTKYSAWMPITTDFQETNYGITHPIYPEEPIQLWQFITKTLANKQISFSFIYYLTGTTARFKNLAIDIMLTDSVTSDVYRLLPSMKWTKELSGTDKIFYQNKAVAVNADQINNFHIFSKTTERTPVAGTIQFTIYRPYDYEGINTWDENYSLLINNVILSTSTIELKTIKIQLSEKSLKQCNENADEIKWGGRKPIANFYSTNFDYDRNTWNLDSFFDGNGKPIEGNLIMSDDNGVQIKDIIKNFREDKNSESYKFELSQIKIFDCEYINRKKRKYRAICEFTREQTYFMAKDSNGLNLPDVPPEADAGWYNTNTKEEGNSNRNLWIRTPFNMDVNALPWVKSGIDHAPNDKWRNHINGFGYYNSITSVKQYPVTVDKSVEITNAIDLREIFTKVYRETHISLRGKNVYSNFLWNDALSVQETTDVYKHNEITTNYVTMTDTTNDLEPKNELNKIVAVHTYEFSTEPTTDKEKTILKLTFDELMTDFLAHFPQCYWFVDSNKDLHIEHIKYYDRINRGKNLTEDYPYILYYQSWEYIKDKLFSLEKYSFKNSGNLDFIDSEVTFDKITTNKRGQDTKNEITGKVFSTDVAFCMENRNSLDNGIVLMIYDTVGEDNICRSGVGQKSGSSIINGDLSIASLLAKYATYEGTWKKGQINKKGFWNNQDGVYDFKTTKHVRQGEEITIKGIFLDKIIFTNLGLGIVAQRKVDYENEVTKIVANYRYSDPFPIYGSGKDEPII